VTLVILVLVPSAISVTADQSKKSTFSFQINTPRRIYYLQAESQENADYWTNGVNDILKTLGTNSDGMCACVCVCAPAPPAIYHHRAVICLRRVA